MLNKSNRKIHINLPKDIHLKLRVKCAYENRTIQEYVAELIKEELAEYNVIQLLETDRKKSNTLKKLK
jgi:plasmid stability protein